MKSILNLPDEIKVQTRLFWDIYFREFKLHFSECSEDIQINSRKDAKPHRLWLSLLLVRSIDLNTMHTIQKPVTPLLLVAHERELVVRVPLPSTMERYTPTSWTLRWHYWQVGVEGNWMMHLEGFSSSWVSNQVRC